MSKKTEKKLANSPDRFSFQKQKYLERKAEEGKTPENSEEVRAMVEYYDIWKSDKDDKEIDTEWQKNNLEYDLRSTEWICDKVKQSDVYAQNLYAAMCNNDFQKLEIIPILKDELWSCSWRYAGGIVADMREEGDYIDWYCSGIRDDYEADEYQRRYVSESTVTEEIREDLLNLGWKVLSNEYTE